MIATHLCRKSGKVREHCKFAAGWRGIGPRHHLHLRLPSRSCRPSTFRAFKAVEATLAELPCPTATTGPRVMTRATSGMWLALRAETIALHETRRGLTNRIHGDGGADRTGGARRPEKRRRP